MKTLCDTCGASITVYGRRATLAHHFCNQRCWRASRPVAMVTFPCDQCGTPVTRPKKGWDKAPKHFCSHACRLRFYRQKPFDFYVQENESGCWIWTGTKDRKGYGRTVQNGIKHLAHRFAWEREHGPVPPGLFVCHHCDTPSCVRPDHLFVGTQSMNMIDAVFKGRLVREALSMAGRKGALARWGQRSTPPPA